MIEMAKRTPRVNLMMRVGNTNEPRASAARRGYGRRWRRIRDRYLAKHPFCETDECGDLGVDVHHKVPKRLGGSDEDSNLMTQCKRHHSQKTRRGG